MLSNSSVNENTPAGTAVGTFGSSPAGDYTYTLIPGDGDSDNGLFEIDGAGLFTKASFDYETKNSCSIRVRITDSEEFSYDTVFAVGVGDVHEPPESMSLSSDTVREKLPAGTAVGVFASYPDNDDPYTYTLVSGDGDTDNAAFTAEGGTLKTADVFYYDTQNTYSIRVRSTDTEGNFFEKSWTIGVTESGPNREPTGITLSNAGVKEGLPAGTAVGTFAAADPDNPYDSHTYSLVSGDGDTGNCAFGIEGDTLKTAAVFDYAAHNSYSIRVRATDSGGTFVEKEFAVGIIEVVINSAPTDISLSSSRVNENQSAGTAVGVFDTADPDSPGDSHTYTLVFGADVFSIEGSTLKTAAVFDFAVQSSYGIRVRSTDAHGESFEKDFIISVLNVNDPPTDILIESRGVNEGKPAGTEAGILSASDPDSPGDTHTYMLTAGEGGTDNDLFTVEDGRLLTETVFDYETKKQCRIRVRVTDSGGLFYEKALTVKINDMNEAPGDMRLNGSSESAAVPENLPAGTAVGRFTVSDPDIGDSHRYYLVVGEPEGWADNGCFYIDGDTVRTSVSFNYEEKNSYTVHIRCNDAGKRGTGDDDAPGSCFRTFIIRVGDVNEPGRNIVLSYRWMDENKPVGTVVGTFTAQGDPDAGDTHTFSLVRGEGDTDNAVFAVTGDALRTAAVFDYEGMKHTYSIRVSAADSGGAIFEEQFAVILNDANDAPSDIFIDRDRIAEKKPAGTAVGYFSTEDPDDPGGTGIYVYELTQDCPDNEYFKVSGGLLRSRTVFDVEIRDSYTVCVRAADGKGGELVKEFVISVAPHEAPVLVCPYDAELDPISENDRDNTGTGVAEMLAAAGCITADGEMPPGIAVTAADNTYGIWQYSLNNGVTWRSFTYAGDRVVDISETSRLLRADDVHRIRFVPYLLTDGDISTAFTFLAWDMSEGTDGETADTRESGGRTAFSADTARAVLTVSDTVAYVSVNISGMVKDFEGNPVEGAGILLKAEDGLVVGRTGTLQDGRYEIKTGYYLRDYAYKKGEIYTLEAFVGRTPIYAFFEENICFTEETDILRDIVLSRDSVMCGQVCDIAGVPIVRAQIEACSETFGRCESAATDSDGIYHFENMPAASDISVKAAAEGYITQEKTGQSFGTSVNFYLETGGSLTGRVLNSEGRGLPSASVEIRSETSGYTRTASAESAAPSLMTCGPMLKPASHGLPWNFTMTIMLPIHTIR